MQGATICGLITSCGERLLLSHASAPSSGQQIDVGPRLKQRITGGLDAVHPRDRIEDDVLLLACVIRGDFLQADFAERALCTLLGPAGRGIVNCVAVLGQLYDYSKPYGFL